jgi:hypothetical protein
MLGWRMRRAHPPWLVKNSGRSPPFLTENEDVLLMSSFLEKMILFYNVHTHTAHRIKSSQLREMFYYFCLNYVLNLDTTVSSTRTEKELH